MMRARVVLMAAAALGLVACGPKAGDPKRQIGAHPYLPPLHQYLLPPMKVASNVGWRNGRPKVAAGLAINAFAKDLKNPRSVYVLPMAMFWWRRRKVLLRRSAGPSNW